MEIEWFPHRPTPEPIPLNSCKECASIHRDALDVRPHTRHNQHGKTDAPQLKIGLDSEGNRHTWSDPCAGETALPITSQQILLISFAPERERTEEGWCRVVNTDADEGRCPVRRSVPPPSWLKFPCKWIECYWKTPYSAKWGNKFTVESLH